MLHPVDRIRSDSIKIIVREVDDMRRTAFYRGCKSSVFPLSTLIRKGHLLILPSRCIKMNGHQNTPVRLQSRSFISHERQHLYPALVAQLGRALD